jgi:hypothetical protein
MCPDQYPFRSAVRKAKCRTDHVRLLGPAIEFGEIHPLLTSLDDRVSALVCTISLKVHAAVTE